MEMLGTTENAQTDTVMDSQEESGHWEKPSACVPVMELGLPAWDHHMDRSDAGGTGSLGPGVWHLWRCRRLGGVHAWNWAGEALLLFLTPTPDLVENENLKNVPSVC